MSWLCVISTSFTLLGLMVHHSPVSRFCWAIEKLRRAVRIAVERLILQIGVIRCAEPQPVPLRQVHVDRCPYPCADRKLCSFAANQLPPPMNEVRLGTGHAFRMPMPAGLTRFEGITFPEKHPLVIKDDGGPGAKGPGRTVRPWPTADP